MKKLFDNGRVVAQLVGSRVEILWNAPTEEDALRRAEAQMPSEILRLLDALVVAVEGRAPGSMSLLVSIHGASKRYTDIFSGALEWLRKYRHVFSLCVFATRNTLVRSSIKVLGLLPGIELKGFETEEEARRYLDERGA